MIELKNKKMNTVTMLLLFSISQINAQQDASIDDLEQTLINMGSSLDLDNIPEAENFHDNEILPLHDEDEYLYHNYLESTQEWNDGQINPHIEIPSTDELIGIAEHFHDEGISALSHYPLFQSSTQNTDSIPHQCNTYVPELLFSLAKFQDPDDAQNVSEQLINVFSQPAHQGFTMENILGEDWQIDAEFEGNTDEFIESDEEFYFLDNWIDDTFFVYQEQQETEDEPYEEAPVFYHHLSNTMVIKKAKPRNRLNSTIDFLNRACNKLADEGVDPNAWMTYEKHDEFTIHYRLCGNHGISSDLYERIINKVYLMPNWSVVKLERCKKFSKTCAPMYVQMIAADILYERKTFKKAGYKVPGHWNVEISSNDPSKGASAFLGTIKLNGAAESSRGLRNLVFHEYFHAIETMYGSEWEYLFNGNLFGSRPSFERNTQWWSQLESLADWAPHALSYGDNPWPDYYDSHFERRYAYSNAVRDARNHLFESSYHPLEYGYLAERYSRNGNDKTSSCLGCDSIKQYLEILDGQPYGARLWKHSYLALYTFIEMMKTGIRPTTGYEIGSLFAFNQFSQDYHLDLLFSRMNRKWVTTSGDFRFFNRFAPKTSTLWPELTNWPPALQKVPTSMKSLFGQCTNKSKPLKRSHAQAVGAKFIHGFTCDMKMSPTGAIFLEVPLENNKLPDKIMVTGVGVKLHNDDINAYRPPEGEPNYRIRPGELINGNLRIFSVPTELTAPNTLDFNETKALSLYGNMATNNAYTISLKNNHPSSNHLYLIIDYPFLSREWLRAPNGNYPQRENFMARIGIVGSWDN